VSSNPREDYRVLGVFPAPTDRFRILFPYSVERDRAAWQWSWGAYAERPGQPTLTAGEMRKMTGKAAEIAAILIGLPPDCDFFAPIRQELLDTGALSPASRAWIAGVLRAVPLRTPQTALRAQLAERRAAYALQLAEAEGLDEATAAQKAGETLESLLAGWRDPLLRRTDAAGRVVEESGVPLRATLAYLFAEVARNFHLIHHPESWIESVTLSQRGDRCADMDWTRLPTRAEMERRLDWEAGAAGPDLLARWLERHDAVPWDHNRGLDDASLEAATPPDMRFLPGGSFFRGLALLDLAEAMLKRAFGGNAVAVRVNAAGQGDYFQVHVDRERADPDEVKAFIRAAFYRRFGLSPSPEFVELHPGGGAVGLRLAEGRGLDPLASRLAPGAGSPAPA